MDSSADESLMSLKGWDLNVFCLEPQVSCWITCELSNCYDALPDGGNPHPSIATVIIFSISQCQELKLFAGLILAHTPLVNSFDIPHQSWTNFLSHVEQWMTCNELAVYHNLYHAVDVMHASWVMLYWNGGDAYLRAPECALTGIGALALLIGALCHDLNHPGMGNSFQIAAQTPYALQYNDSSPLENHHIALAWSIVRKPECDIFAALSAEEKKYMRKLLITSILRTDMDGHKMLQDELEAFLCTSPEPLTRDSMNPKDVEVRIRRALSLWSPDAPPSLTVSSAFPLSVLLLCSPPWGRLECSRA